jgi:hypothetical protein
MKKVTLFVSSELRKELASDTHKWREAYRVALWFFYEIVNYGTRRYDWGPWKATEAPDHGGDGGGYAKYLCGCHSESGFAKKVFAEAQRVEAHVYLREGTTRTFLYLELRAYKRGVKEPFAKHAWSFEEQNPNNQIARSSRS